MEGICLMTTNCAARLLLRALFLLLTVTTLATAQAIQCSITQITNASDGNSIQPSISANGRRIAFTSAADLTGGNSDHNFEIFLFDAATRGVTQITNSTEPFLIGPPSISASGRQIVFSSDADLTGSNNDHSLEIFLFDTATGAFTQVTNSTTPGLSFRGPSISASGRRIAFHSLTEPTGGDNEGDHVWQVFLATCQKHR